MLKTTLAKVLTVKIAVAAAGVVAAGGVAVAAVTGTLPTQGEDTTTISATSTVAPAADQETGRQQSEAHGKPAETGKDKDATQNNPDDKTKANGNGNSASPSPSLDGLCHAYTAGAGSEHGKALENPAFGALITAAGGKDKVPAFCDDLLGATKPGQPASPPGKPSTHPTGPNQDNPVGKPNGTPPSATPGR